MIGNDFGNLAVEYRACGLGFIPRPECDVKSESLYGNLSTTDGTQQTWPAVSNDATTPRGMELQFGACGRPFHDKNNVTIQR